MEAILNDFNRLNMGEWDQFVLATFPLHVLQIATTQSDSSGIHWENHPLGRNRTSLCTLQGFDFLIAPIQLLDEQHRKKQDGSWKEFCVRFKTNAVWIHHFQGEDQQFPDSMIWVAVVLSRQGHQVTINLVYLGPHPQFISNPPFLPPGAGEVKAKKDDTGDEEVKGEKEDEQKEKKGEKEDEKKEKKESK